MWCKNRCTIVAYKLYCLSIVDNNKQALRWEAKTRFGIVYRMIPNIRIITRSQTIAISERSLAIVDHDENLWKSRINNNNSINSNEKTEGKNERMRQRATVYCQNENIQKKITRKTHAYSEPWLTQSKHKVNSYGDFQCSENVSDFMMKMRQPEWKIVAIVIRELESKREQRDIDR